MYVSIGLAQTLVYGINPNGLPIAQANNIASIIWDELCEHIPGEELKKKTTMIVLAQSHNCYVGCATLRQDKDNQKLWYFESFCVREKFRRKGIGSDILQVAFDLIPPKSTMICHVDKHRKIGSKALDYNILTQYYELRGFQLARFDDHELEFHKEKPAEEL